MRAAVPIERHSLLSDRRAFALVTPDADVTWLCQPAPDSPALFASLLGGDGHFSVRPQRNQLPLGQQYAPGTMSVRTRWTGLQVTDSLSGGLVRSVEGRVPAVVEFAPRPDFGQNVVQLEPVPDGLRVAGTPIELRSPGVDWRISGGTATAVLTPPVVLELRWGAPPSTEDWRR
ncbi:trehalase-like domain-containing protein [Lentzea pudingi]|uniref:trehalase-like domain-containing protein n=1 Tax=Lentzea pudingi TaxID=1789439 RepID=UPI00166B906E|nr:trehalase-like domain-containing protein [Lentzea pudingi]